MRTVMVGLAISALLGCNGLFGPHGPLDGSWVDSRGHGLPQSFSLAQHGASLRGRGTAMGVDAPMNFDVSGTANLPSVTLRFVDDGSGDGVNWSGVLTSDGRLVGLIVSDTAYGSMGDSISYKRP